MSRPLLVCLALLTSLTAQTERRRLREVVEDILEPLVRNQDRFELRLTGFSTRVIDITAPRVAGKQWQDAKIRLTFRRTGEGVFELIGDSPWVEFVLRRDGTSTTLQLPRKQVAFVGSGADSDEHLAPAGFLRRLLGNKRGLVDALRTLALTKAVNLSTLDADRTWFRIDDKIGIRSLPGDDAAVLLRSRDEIIEGLKALEIRRTDPPAKLAPLALDGYTVRKLERRELERMMFRSVRRLLQTYVPPLRPANSLRAAKTSHGELRLVDGQRLVLLHGTPTQIGKAQGELLGDLVRRTVDSTLYLVGMVETLREGKWFPDVLSDAWRQLSPHIPARHIRELDALADAIPGLSRQELRLSNVFPEYFHCSGFALFGRATKDGKLYHGRVLDYMTMIGLQHAAVTTIVKPTEGYAFLNVGYAGFIGSVTGMNERQISLGEMGGRGRFLWNGVPMATLMRRALEECGSLAEVKQLWTDNPRTCEYFYVFADGKTRRAVGVAASPDKLQFLDPGQTHELLGTGIPDAIVLSADSRLRRLRNRILEHHGKIDVQRAIRLMDRPVAMSSNLHNALMIPEDGVIHIAHASQDRPAAEMGYVRYELRELLKALPPERQLEVRDTIVPARDDKTAATAMMREFQYPARKFKLRVRPHRKGDGAKWHSLVTFPSPKPPAKQPEDQVVLEWYHANPRRMKGHGTAKAVLVMHILDGRMRVARGVAQVLARKGLHAFVMHMPGYGRRQAGPIHDPAQFLIRAQQAVADTRRARDAIAALPGVDPRSISIQGTSLGGFIAALAAAVDHSFDQTFLMLAGGGLVKMFETGQKDTAMLRRSLEQAGITPTQIKTILQAIDPARLAHRLRSHRTWLYSAKSDTVVPPDSARALSRAAGLDSQHHLWYSGNHYTCAVHLPTILAHMIEQLR